MASFLRAMRPLSSAARFPRSALPLRSARCFSSAPSSSSPSSSSAEQKIPEEATPEDLLAANYEKPQAPECPHPGVRFTVQHGHISEGPHFPEFDFVAKMNPFDAQPKPQVWYDFRPDLVDVEVVRNVEGDLVGIVEGELVIFPDQETTLEWVLTTPVDTHLFEEVPIVKEWVEEEEPVFQKPIQITDVKEEDRERILEAHIRSLKKRGELPEEDVPEGAAAAAGEQPTEKPAEKPAASA